MRRTYLNVIAKPPQDPADAEMSEPSDRATRDDPAGRARADRKGPTARRIGEKRRDQADRSACKQAKGCANLQSNCEESCRYALPRDPNGGGAGADSESE